MALDLASSSVSVRARLCRDDRAPLALAGAGLITLALVLGFIELALPVDYVLLLAGLGLLVTSVIGPSQLTSFALVGTAALGTVWHVAAPTLPLTLALLVVGASGVIHAALRGARRATDEVDQTRHVWIAGACATLAASFAGYYQFVTLGVGADSSVRRVVITLAWMVAGVVGMALGARRQSRGIRDAGALFVLVALAKTLVYDTTHLGGLERIALLVLGGGALLVGARAMRPAVTA